MHAFSVSGSATTSTGRCFEQIADDAGGLSAFISRSDNFARAAQAFRRKLLQPVGTNVALTFDGVEVYDLQPKTIPNLYHGMPLRVYGRYRKSGPAKVTVRADLEESELRRTATVNFPATEAGNPEIERMWAFHKVQGLLKEADRAGSREAVIGEIVRLGEAYSIVSEYTSFLVLENDAEYQRWKLERRNVLRIERDRRRQRELDDQLASIRRGVPADLGPLADSGGRAPALSVQGSAPVAQPFVAQPRPAADGSSGGGALDPLAGIMAASLAVFALLRWLQGRGQET